MSYNFETIVVNKRNQRINSYNPRGAYYVVKRDGEGTIFFRCKALKLEKKIVFAGGKLVDVRLKVNRQIIVDDEQISQAVCDCLDELHEAMGLWNS